MEKIVSILIISFFVSFSLFSENLLEGRKYLHSEIVEGIIFDFAKDHIVITEYNLSEDTEKVFNTPYKVVNDSGLMFLLCGDDFEDKYLCLYSEGLILLYDKDGAWFFRGESMIPTTSNIHLLGFYKDFFTSSSYLTEEGKSGLIEYKIDNLSNPDLPNPWVEGVRGYGIGERIFPKINKDSLSSDKILVISNGYVSYNNPNLYKKNSRVKKIRIRDNASGYFKDIVIPDSPNLFEIPLYNIIGNDGFEMEILAVYKGTHYDDTCINFLGLIDLYGY